MTSEFDLREVSGALDGLHFSDPRRTGALRAIALPTGLQVDYLAGEMFRRCLRTNSVNFVGNEGLCVLAGRDEEHLALAYTLDSDGSVNEVTLDRRSVIGSDGRKVASVKFLENPSHDIEIKVGIVGQGFNRIVSARQFGDNDTGISQIYIEGFGGVIYHGVKGTRGGFAAALDRIADLDRPIFPDVGSIVVGELITHLSDGLTS